MPRAGTARGTSGGRRCHVLHLVPVADSDAAVIALACPCIAPGVVVVDVVVEVVDVEVGVVVDVVVGVVVGVVVVQSWQRSAQYLAVWGFKQCFGSHKIPSLYLQD